MLKKSELITMDVLTGIPTVMLCFINGCNFTRVFDFPENDEKDLQIFSSTKSLINLIDMSYFISRYL
jgi:hypothetical protein